MAEALTGLSGFCRIVDDIVIYDNTIEDMSDGSYNNVPINK